MTISNENKKLVCVAVITTVHGVHGNVKVKSFTRNPEDFAKFGSLCDSCAKHFFNLRIVGENKGVFIVRIEGVTDRTQAEKLRGLELFVDRDKLPETSADEFYYTDLIGMTAKTPEGKILGKVKAVYNFGAGDMLEIDSVEDFISFSKRNIPDVDLKNRVITVNLPESVKAEPEMAES